MVHKVNFVCAKVIAQSVLKTIFGAFRSEQPRHICGPFRTLTWVAKNFKHTPVDNHKITEDRIKNSDHFLIPQYFKLHAFSSIGTYKNAGSVVKEVSRSRLKLLLASESYQRDFSVQDTIFLWFIFQLIFLISTFSNLFFLENFSIISFHIHTNL